MPRTKISKNAKRNRQPTNNELAERLKEFDTKADQILSDLDMKLQQNLRLITSEFNSLRTKLPGTILQMKFGNLLDLDVNTLDEYKQKTGDSINNSKITTINSTVASINRKMSKDDEGYITEDGVLSSAVVSSAVPPNATRALGPLSSAKARGRHRRSRSACTYFKSATTKEDTQKKMKTSKTKNGSNHTSEIRTMSVDRAEPVTPKIAPNAPLSILRYARVGETIISLSGSPVVAQGLLDSMANVNIPLRNGIISLKPTKLNGIDREIIMQIDQETLHQIKQLQSNLNIIMSSANKNDL